MTEDVWFWALFLAIVIILLIIDLKCFGKGGITLKKSLYMTAFWIAIALIFGVFVWCMLGAELGLAYYTGYIIEKAMSIDNLFVFILIFAYFGIPDEYQHKALYYGVIGALVFRAIFIFAGAELIENFEAVMYIFGAILIIAALKTIFEKEEENKENKIAVFMSKHIRSSPELDGDKLTTIYNGKRVVTPLLLCIIVIELSDIIFAVDSVPAVLAITTDRFVVYTSNIFAVLGLRSLYFAIKESMKSLKYLKYGLGIILLFIGFKLMLGKIVEISVVASLVVILGILAVTIILSLYSSKKDRMNADTNG